MENRAERPNLLRRSAGALKGRRAVLSALILLPAFYGAAINAGPMNTDLSGSPRTFAGASMGALEPVSTLPLAPSNLQVQVLRE